MFLALFASACKEELVVADGDGLADARFRPRVLVSAPALNSAGPYETWTLASPYQIDVRFNKLMVSSSVARGITLSSSARPVQLSVIAYFGEPLSAQFMLYPQDSGQHAFAAPRIGEVLTLRASVPVLDVNGNSISAGALGTLLPEPYFRVREIRPSGKKAIGSVSSLITLAFNSQLDSSILGYVSTEPPANVPWTLVPGEPTILTLPVSAMPYSRLYAVRVAAGGRDALGNVMPLPFAASLVPARLYFKSATRDTALVRIYRGTKFSFSQSLDTSTVRAAVHIEPAVQGGIRASSGGAVLSVVPFQEYAPLTRYTITIDTSLRSKGGFPLEEPVAYSFTTDAFRVSGTTPANGADSVATDVVPLAAFTARLDSASAARAFRIDPPAEGSIQVRTGALFFTFTPASLLSPATVYTVTIDTTLRSQWGARMESPYTFRFTTVRE
jgi:hypothetical protein